mmetsp:Transcript_32828/g.102441  ORF Transcript_32828/g.102441 Transcript_32828/m.102441 type:complete len:80 (+) Transcript_32828:206-445(+)
MCVRPAESEAQETQARDAWKIQVGKPMQARATAQTTRSEELSAACSGLSPRKAAHSLAWKPCPADVLASSRSIALPELS